MKLETDATMFFIILTKIALFFQKQIYNYFSYFIKKIVKNDLTASKAGLKLCFYMTNSSTNSLLRFTTYFFPKFNISHTLIRSISYSECMEYLNLSY